MRSYWGFLHWKMSDHRLCKSYQGRDRPVVQQNGRWRPQRETRNRMVDNGHQSRTLRSPCLVIEYSKQILESVCFNDNYSSIWWQYVNHMFHLIFDTIFNVADESWMWWLHPPLAAELTQYWICALRSRKTCLPILDDAKFDGSRPCSCEVARFNIDIQCTDK